MLNDNDFHRERSKILSFPLEVTKEKRKFASKKCNLISGDTIMNTISVDSNIYRGAELYAKLHNLSLGQMVEKYLLRFQVPTARKQPSLTLPAHLEKLGGCLAGIEDENDKKLNYLLEKYK